MSQTLTKEYIGFEEIDDGIYNLYYCDYLIGKFFEEITRIKDIIDRVLTTPMSSSLCHKKHDFNECQNITIAAANGLS